jgi:hypothetical protein
MYYNCFLYFIYYCDLFFELILNFLFVCLYNICALPYLVILYFNYNGMVQGWAAYTKVDRWDRTKLSSLHRSGNHKLPQVRE